MTQLFSVASDPTHSFVVTRSYDGLGRGTTTNTNGVLVTSTFDAYGRALTQSTPHTSGEAYYFTTTTYDVLGRPIAMSAPDGTTTTNVYDGLSTTVTDANAHSTTSVTDVLGRTLSVTPPTGPSVAFTYDALGNMLTASRGGATVSLGYDIAGRKVSMADPDMGNWTYEYDALSNLTRQKDAKNQVTCLYYDNLSRLVGKDFFNNTTCPTIANPAAGNYAVDYNYDETTYGIGYRTSMEDVSGRTDWAYDTRGRVAQESKTINGHSAFLTQWNYNSADLPKTMTYPDDEVVTINYNNNMLMTSMAGTVTYAQNFLYDSAGRLTSRTLGNGVTQKYFFKAWNVQGGRLDKSIAGTGAFNTTTQLFDSTLQKMTYTYDSVGNVTNIYDSKWGETQAFDYDALNRLTSAAATSGLANYAETYTYNPTTGNLETKAGTTLNYDDANHVHAATSANGNTYQYDSNGNQTTRTVGGQTYSLSYDAENRLISVSGPSLSATFIYDGDGRRVKSIVNGETIFFAGGHFELKSTTGEVTKYYNGVAMRKYVVPQTTTLTYLLGDHLGSTSLAVDSATGEVIETRYKPWGEVRWTTENTTLPTRYTYTGQYSYIADDATDIGAAGFGLMFYNARWYDPQLGRFAQADSIVPGGVQGYDRYAYVGNNPVNATDPSGHRCVGEPGECVDDNGNLINGASDFPAPACGITGAGSYGYHCSLGQIQGASLADRLAWFKWLTQQMNETVAPHASEWFNNILTVIAGFMGTGQSDNTWMMNVDAAILYSVQNGFAASIGNPNPNVDSANTNAANLWKTFFDHLGNSDNSNESQRALIGDWGRAEDASTKYGTDKFGQPTSRDDKWFLIIGNSYRRSLFTTCQVEDCTTYMGSFYDPRSVWIFFSPVGYALFVNYAFFSFDTAGYAFTGH